MGSCDPAPPPDGTFLDFSNLDARDSLAASMARNLRSFLDVGIERLVDALGLASVSVPFALFNITQACPNLHIMDTVLGHHTAHDGPPYQAQPKLSLALDRVHVDGLDQLDQTHFLEPGCHNNSAPHNKNGCHVLNSSARIGGRSAVEIRGALRIGMGATSQRCDATHALQLHARNVYRLERTATS